MDHSADCHFVLNVNRGHTDNELYFSDNSGSCLNVYTESLGVLHKREFCKKTIVLCY